VCYRIRVSRVLALLMLVVMAGPASGAFALAEAACQDDCGDTGETGDCCACLCNTRSITVLPGPVTAPAIDRPVVRSAIAITDDAPPDPEPAEILHVPKRAA
jgi:hypothetical protein